MGKARAALAAVIILVVALVPPPAVEAQSPEVMQAIERVEESVEEIRGLKFLEEVETRFMSQDELRQKLIDDLNEDYTQDEWERDEGILKLLGFLEEDQDYYGLLLDLYTEQIAGFYSPADKYLALISGEESMNAYDRLVLSHELTHALQDQHFDLYRPPFHDPDSENNDAVFAASCLVEGDATVAMYSYAETFTPKDQWELQEAYGDIKSEKMDAAPRYIRDSLLFPYQEGEKFARRLRDKQGVTGLDEAFSRPPASTEQVMHPEKYFAGEMPLPVECPDISSGLGEGWELKDTDVMGEFDIMELLMNEVKRADAERAAEGWGGCQYRYYVEGGSGEKLAVIDLAWDSQQEAEEFAAVFSDYADSRCGFGSGSFRRDLGWYLWDGDGPVTGISMEGVSTRVLIADTANNAERAAEALGARGEGIEGLINRSEDGGVGSSGSNNASRVNMVLVVALVSALFLLGAALIAAMFFLLHKSGTA
jgi:hypothetical protein